MQTNYEDILHRLKSNFVSTQTYVGVVHAAKSILCKEGIQGLYKGLMPTLLQIAPQTGFQFGFYAIFKSMYYTVFQVDKSNSKGRKTNCNQIEINSQIVKRIID